MAGWNGCTCASCVGAYPTEPALQAVEPPPASRRVRQLEQGVEDYKARARQERAGRLAAEQRNAELERRVSLLTAAIRDLEATLERARERAA